MEQTYYASRQFITDVEFYRNWCNNREIRQDESAIALTIIYKFIEQPQLKAVKLNSQEFKVFNNAKLFAQSRR